MALKGIYVFAPAATAARAVQQVMQGPFRGVMGFDWLCGWHAVEPSKGVFDWTLVDSARQAASNEGYQSQLCLLPGFAEPAWLLTEVPTIQIQQYNTGKFVTMANPVTPAFLVELGSVIAAFGSHCAGAADIASVQTTGGGDQGEMVMGKLVSGVWADHGITPMTLLAAWEAMVHAWQQAFPHTARSLAIGEPLGHKLPILPQLLQSLTSTYPHHGAQQNGLKETTPTGASSYWQDLHALHAAGHVVGWQMFGGNMTAANLKTACDIGISAGASFLQIYLDDIVNPANTAVLQAVAAQLAATP